MKKIIYLLSIAFISMGSLYAQQSDYLTIQEFKEEVELFKYQIDNAITSEQLKNFELDINEFLVFYEEHFDLINRALYPVTIESHISGLKASLITNENRLILIEHQREQLFEMSNRVTAQRNEINRLYSITDSLKNEILNSQASETRLSGIISLYRTRLEQRDKLIFEMIDSLLITHENLIFNKMNEREIQSYTISGSQNPLSWIQSVLDENLDQSNIPNRLFDVEDYIRMHALQQHFEDVWNKVGEDFVQVYGGEQKNSIEQSIGKSIDDWRIASTQKMWSAIDQYLDVNEIELSSFDSRDSFYLALEAFIQNGQRVSETEFLTTNGYTEYQKITDFWNSTFKNNWNLNSNESRLLSSGEIEMIDVALTQWEQTSRPIHPMLVAILSIMIVSLTGFILVMLRAKASR